jgi:hypothetical protein
MIPPRLIRTVPEHTLPEAEAWWEAACMMHPDWEHVTFRDPINAGVFPLTRDHWARCNSGAQLAGLIRLEALYTLGGIYIDSDVELYRPLDSLRQVRGFACWEDGNTIPDAVLGFEPEHPVLRVMIDEAIAKLGDGAWESGPGVTTRNLQGRDDVLLLPPGSFFPIHWSRKRLYDSRTPQGARRLARVPAEQPAAFGIHHWRHSWAGA